MQPAQDTTLYAQWQINTYTLSFNIQGGEGAAPNSQQVKFEDFAVSVPNPSRTGHTFVGWNTSADGSGNGWDFATSRMPSGNTTLYAQWETNSYNLHFNTNGGHSTPPPPQVVAFNTLAANVANPSRTGFTFAGWNTKEDGSGNPWNFKSTKMPANDVTLYAQWSVNGYIVSFDTNGGDSFAPSNQTVDYGSLVARPANPTRTGHSFIGWAATQDGTTQIWDFLADTMPAHNLTLYAQWERNAYTMAFSLNGGSGVAPANQMVLFEDLLQPVAKPARTGHTFSGWNTKQDGSGSYWDFASSRMPANDATLYAQWSKNKYKVVFSLNGGKGSAPASQKVLFDNFIKPVKNPAREGNVFVGWNTNKDGSGTSWSFTSNRMPAKNVTLYAQWSLSRFNLHFNLNGGAGTPPPSQKVFFGKLAQPVNNPSRDGYVFTGWNTRADGRGTMWDFATTTQPEGTVILYAQWRQNSYVLSFSLNGGSGNPPGSQNVSLNALAVPVKNPVRKGYSFLSWNTEQNGAGVTWDFATSRMPARNTTLYAQWKKDSYTVTFELNGAEGTPPPMQTVSYGGLVSPVENPVRKNHVFVGWNTKQDGSGTTWNFATSRMQAKNLVLHAQWSASSFTLHFNLNGGTGIAPQSQTVALGELAQPVQDPAREGYTFAGWNTQPDGEGLQWDFAKTRMKEENTILYAQWDINKYMLSFDLQGGKGDAPPTQKVEFEGLAEPVEAPVKEGDSFIGWNTAPDGSGETWDFATSRMPAKDTTLYAQWESETISGNSIPFGSFTMKGVMSVLNMALSLVCIFLTAIMGYLFFGKRYRRSLPLAIINLVLTLGTIIVFAITADFTLPLVVVNSWSLPILLVTAAQGVVLYFFQRENAIFLKETKVFHKMGK